MKIESPMHPWLIHYPPVSTYGFYVLAGIILAWLLARRIARRIDLDHSHIDLLLPLVTAAGIAGAYLPEYLGGPPGTVLLAALLAGTSAGILYALATRIPLGQLGDATAAPIALAIACGRLGCFFAGCCYGTPCTLGITFPENSFAARAHPGPVHPVQLYEAAACLLIALLCTRRQKISGEQFLRLALLYSLTRFPLEFLRADNPPAVGGLTLSQIACLAILALTLLTRTLRRHFANPWGLHVATP